MPDLSESEKSILKDGHNQRDHDVHLALILGNDQHRSRYKQFCNELHRVAPGITIQERSENAPDAEQDQTTELRIRPNLRYRLIPTGKAFESFVQVLFQPKSLSDRLPEALKQVIQKIRMPAHFKLYISPHCPVCPLAVSQMLGVAATSTTMTLTLIDGSMYPEAVTSDQVMSAPTLILDNRYRWTGPLDLKEIVKLASGRDPASLSTDYFKGLLEDGAAKEVAQMMVADAIIYPAFIDLLAHPKWPVRLGAMVAVEYIAAEKSQLARQVVDPLWERFHQAEDAVKGDILYLFGEVGGRQATKYLKDVLAGRFAAEVRQAAQEALGESI